VRDDGIAAQFMVLRPAAGKQGKKEGQKPEEHGFIYHGSFHLRLKP